MKLEKYGEAIEFILANQNEFIDKPNMYHRLALIAIKANKDSLAIAIDYSIKYLYTNSENLQMILCYLKAKNVDCGTETIIDVFKIKEKKAAKNILLELKSKFKKSKLIEKLLLFLSEKEEFYSILNNYLNTNISNNIPSILRNIRSIYDYQEEKILIIEEIIQKHIESIGLNNSLDLSLTKELKNKESEICWVYYIAAQHYFYKRDLNKALVYINSAIDSTPSVPDFYIIKSKIFKYCDMTRESAVAYEKVKTYLTNLG